MPHPNSPCVPTLALLHRWQHQFYYLFGFLGLVFLILLITCAEITIVLCYFQLCSEVGSEGARGEGGMGREMGAAWS